jgi:septum formation protein
MRASLMKIVLASESASRRRAMDILGLPYQVFPARIDEKAIREDDPERLACVLAEAKAKEVAKSFHDAVIVAGDAVVWTSGRIYEKPAGNLEAVEFLTEFSGTTVDFVTAIAVLNSANKKLQSAIQRSHIAFRKLSHTEIHDYVRRYAVTNFAGAFDGDGVIRFADHVSGSYNFATGLALNDLVSLLRLHGVEI